MNDSVHNQDPLALRQNALDLLKRASEIDGKKPFVVVHSHEYGETTYMHWSKGQPDEVAAANLLDSKYEPDRGESLLITDEGDISLEALVGVEAEIAPDDGISPPVK